MKVRTTSQPPHARAELLGVRPLGWRRDVRVAGRRAVYRVEDRGGVADRARDDELDREAGDVVADQRPFGGPLAGRLETDEAALRSRDPDRAAAVVRVRDRN